ncbi:MAG: hypothetical protein H6661_11070 [Ardenticatenaceae bacterium]|nr:hypothetical protein [Ardenticatenaceae bacterium]
MIYGRSDSTINRQGIRMGTSEIYRVVESFDEVIDSLIIDLELLGRESYMPLFIVLRPGLELDDDLRARIKQKLREEVSPRHVPNEIIQVEQIPYTLSGKKMEVPIRKILLGMDVQQAAKREAPCATRKAWLSSPHFAEARVAEVNAMSPLAPGTRMGRNGRCNSSSSKAARQCMGKRHCPSAHTPLVQMGHVGTLRLAINGSFTKSTPAN